MSRKSPKPTKLDFSGKKLSNLAGQKGLEGAKSPLKIKLSSNLFEEVPVDELAQVDVRALDLAKNCIRSLPTNLSALKTLEVLDLSANKINDLGQELLSLVKLRVLNLSANQLTVVPSVIPQLVSLESLGLAKNLLHLIPTSLTLLTNLQDLDISGNPLVSPPGDIIQKGHQAVINFLKAQSNTVGASVNTFVPLARAPYIAEWIKPVPDSPTTNRSQPKTLFEATELGPPFEGHFYVHHSVYSDQGCRDYMEDFYVAINHVTLAPSESRRSRRKKHESKTSHASFGLNSSSSEIPSKPNATSSDPVSEEVNDNNHAPVEQEAIPTLTKVPLSPSTPEPPTEDSQPKSSEGQIDTTTSSSKGSKASAHSSITDDSSSTNEVTSATSDTKRSVSPTSTPAPKLSKTAMTHAKERSRTSSLHASTPALLPSSSRNMTQTPPEGEHMALFAVFDGHAGARCSKFMMENFPKIFFDLKATRQGEIPVGLYKAFHKAESHYCQVAKAGGWNDGSTAVVSVVHGHNLLLGHVGDSRAVLCRGKTAIELTHDHKPDRADETARITGLGGTVEKQDGASSIARVNGHLAVSRAFGDVRMKETQRFISAEPEISVVPLVEDDKFIIIASDGLWDVLTNQEAVDFVRRDSSKHKSAKNLVKRALKIGTTDNITAIVIWLTWVSHPPFTQSSSSSALLGAASGAS